LGMVRPCGPPSSCTDPLTERRPSREGATVCGMALHWLALGVDTLDARSCRHILNGPCNTRASSSLAAPSAELLLSVAGFRAWEDVPSNAAPQSRTAPPGTRRGAFFILTARLPRTRIARRSPARLGDPASPPFTTVAAMFAFSPDRHAVNLRPNPAGNGTRRTGSVQPSVHPGTPVSAPVFPATAPVEPSHERAYPQADGEP